VAVARDTDQLAANIAVPVGYCKALVSK